MTEQQTTEILQELHRLRMGQQAIMHVLYAQSGAMPNPVPWLGFSVLSESVAANPPAIHTSDQVEQALRTFGIDPEGVV